MRGKVSYVFRQATIWRELKASLTELVWEP